MNRPAVPKGVIRGIEDLVNGDTATKEEIEEVLDIDGIDVTTDITGIELNNIDQSDFTTAIEENDGKSINMVYETETENFIGFSIHMFPENEEMVVEYQKWRETTDSEGNEILERKET